MGSDQFTLPSINFSWIHICLDCLDKIGYKTFILTKFGQHHTQLIVESCPQSSFLFWFTLTSLSVVFGYGMQLYSAKPNVHSHNDHLTVRYIVPDGHKQLRMSDQVAVAIQWSFNEICIPVFGGWIILANFCSLTWILICAQNMTDISLLCA